MIELSGLTKTYGETTVVDHVSAQIESGGVVSIIGANGAGKSTVLSMIARLVAMDNGSVFVDEHDVLNTPSDVLAKKLSILRQENTLNVRLTVRDLVGFGRFPHSKGRLRPDDTEHIDRALDYLNLNEFQDRYVDELSGGQRQRAYVAMVLAQDTDYILLDEPLNNLDMRHSVQMMQHLHRAATELGRTVVIVLHDINFAGHYADRICAAKNGRIVHFGTPEEIMRDDILTEVFDTPVEVVDGPRGRLAVYY